MKTWICNHISSIFISVIAVLSPIQSLFLTVGFLVVADFLFGLYRAYKIKEVITSRKMANTISKLILYNVMILSVYLSNHYIINTGIPVEKIAAGLIGIVELKSLDESFSTIFGFGVYDKMRDALQRGVSDTKEDKKNPTE